MQNEYNRIIQERADHVFEVMAKRVSSEDMPRIRAAFELAREAHAPQRRKTGEPYIFHPIAVANIAAEELMLGANPVIACFLHDVVEDTPYTIDDIRDRYGDDVVSVDYKADETLYPLTLRVRAVDRSHLFVDLVDCITNTFHLSMESFNTKTDRNIVVCKIRFGVHSYAELKTIINHISAIDGVDEVRRLDEDDELFNF